MLPSNAAKVLRDQGYTGHVSSMEYDWLKDQVVPPNRLKHMNLLWHELWDILEIPSGVYNERLKKMLVAQGIDRGNLNEMFRKWWNTPLNLSGGIQSTGPFMLNPALGSIYQRNGALNVLTTSDGRDTAYTSLDAHEISGKPRTVKNLFAGVDVTDVSNWTVDGNVTFSYEGDGWFRLQNASTSSSGEAISFALIASDSVLDRVFRGCAYFYSADGNAGLTFGIRRGSGGTNAFDNVDIELSGDSEATAQPLTTDTVTGVASNVGITFTVAKTATLGTTCDDLYFRFPTIIEVTGQNDQNPVLPIPVDTPVGPILTPHNGTFISATGWSLGTGWSIADGLATCNGAGTGYIWAGAHTTTGKRIVIDIAIDRADSGTIQVYSAGAGTSVVAEFSTVGAHQHVMDAGTTVVYIRSKIGDQFDGDMSLFSVREATTGLYESDYTNPYTSVSGVITETGTALPLHNRVWDEELGCYRYAVYEHAATQDVLVGKRLIVSLSNSTYPNGSNGYWYEVTVAGTLADNSDTWTTTIGGTTVSGTATVRCGGYHRAMGIPHSTALTNEISTPYHVASAEADWGGGSFTSQTDVNSVIPGQKANHCVCTAATNGQLFQTSGTLGSSTEGVVAILESGDQSVASWVHLWDNTLAATELRVNVNWSTFGVTTTGSTGTSPNAGLIRLGKGPNGGDLVCVWGTVTPANSGNARKYIMHPGGNSPSANDDCIVHFYGGVESSVVSMLPWSGTRVAETWVYDVANLSDATGAVLSDIIFPLDEADMSAAAQQTNLLGNNSGTTDPRVLAINNAASLVSDDGTNQAELQEATFSIEGSDVSRIVVTWSSAEDDLSLEATGNSGNDSSTKAYAGSIGASAFNVFGDYGGEAHLLNLVLTKKYANSTERGTLTDYDTAS